MLCSQQNKFFTHHKRMIDLITFGFVRLDEAGDRIWHSMTAQRTKHLNYFFSSFRFLKSGSWIPSDYRSTKYVIFASGLHLMKMQERSQRKKNSGFDGIRTRATTTWATKPSCWQRGKLWWFLHSRRRTNISNFESRWSGKVAHIYRAA